MSPFEAVDKFKAKMSVRRLCDSFGVSPSSYYAWAEVRAVEAGPRGCPADREGASHLP